MFTEGTMTFQIPNSSASCSVRTWISKSLATKDIPWLHNSLKADRWQTEPARQSSRTIAYLSDYNKWNRRENPNSPQGCRIAKGWNFGWLHGEIPSKASWHILLWEEKGSMSVVHKLPSKPYNTMLNICRMPSQSVAPPSSGQGTLIFWWCARTDIWIYRLLKLPRRIEPRQTFVFKSAQTIVYSILNWYAFRSYLATSFAHRSLFPQ